MEYDLQDPIPLPLRALRGRGMLAASSFPSIPEKGDDEPLRSARGAVETLMAVSRRY